MSGALVIDTHNGGSFSGTWDGLPFTAQLQDSVFASGPFPDGLGNTLILNSCVKGGALVGFWEGTDGTAIWGGSFFANQD